MKLVLIPKPARRQSFTNIDTLPLDSVMKTVRLDRQYRSGTKINSLILELSEALGKQKMFCSLLPIAQNPQPGHEIPGLVSEWYHIKGNRRGISCISTQ